MFLRFLIESSPMTKILVRIELSQIGNVLKTAEDKFFAISHP